MLLIRRMHSSRMRTFRCSGRLSCHAPTPCYTPSCLLPHTLPTPCTPFGMHISPSPFTTYVSLVDGQTVVDGNSVTFNEHFVQCFFILSSCLRDPFKLACLTKSSSHTSLTLTNSGLVVTKLGPVNSC